MKKSCFLDNKKHVSANFHNKENKMLKRVFFLVYCFTNFSPSQVYSGTLSPLS